MKIMVTCFFMILSCLFLGCEGDDSSKFQGDVLAVTISGSVKDYTTNLALEGVIISISPAAINLISDLNGNYEATLDSNADYILNFSKTNYLSLEYSLYTESNSTQALQTVFLLSTNAGGTSNASGIITSTSTGDPLNAVAISLRSGVNTRSGIVTNITTSAMDGTYAFTNITSGTYTMEMGLSSYITGYETLSVIGGNAGANQDFALSPLVLLVDGNNSVNGVIKDALNGSGLNGVQVDLRIGTNNQTGPIVLTTMSLNDGTNDGTYSFNNIASGDYNIEMSLATYITGYGNIDVLPDVINDNKNFILSPELLGSEKMRLILTWGANPRDLDAHLKGTRDDNTTYKVDYNQTTIVGEAKLDVDESNGFGPETITFENISLGKYVYYIHKFAGTGDLNSAGAIVQVVEQNKTPYYVDVNTTGIGDYWEVLRIENNITTIINTIVASEPAL